MFKVRAMQSPAVRPEADSDSRMRQNGHSRAPTLTPITSEITLFRETSIENQLIFFLALNDQGQALGKLMPQALLQL